MESDPKNWRVAELSWDVAPNETLSALTPEIIFSASLETLETVVTSGLQENMKPTYEQVRCLLARYIDNAIAMDAQFYFSEVSIAEVYLSRVNKVKPPKPQGLITADLRNYKPDCLDEFSEDDFYDRRMLMVCARSFAALDKADQDKLIEEVAPYFLSVKDIGELTNWLLATQPLGYWQKTGVERKNLARSYMNAIYEMWTSEDFDRRTERACVEDELKSDNPDSTQDIDLGNDESDKHSISAREVTTRHQQPANYQIHPENNSYYDADQLLAEIIGESYFRGLEEKEWIIWLDFLSEKQDFDKILLAIRPIAHIGNHAEFLNAVRSLLAIEQTEPNKKENLIKIGRVLLGAEPDEESVEVYRSLSGLYDAISFAEYKPNQEATRMEVDIIDKTLALLIQGNDDQDRILLQIASGTGRHLQEYVKRRQADHKYPKVKFFGIDASAKHVEQAKNALEGLGGRESADMVSIGSWDDIQLPDNSVDMAISLGRDLPHAETGEGFERAIKSVFRVLKPGGIFIFDMPNPDKGAYPESRRRVLRAMERIHGRENRDVTEEYASYIGTIIDGPETGKLYNRYCPPPENVMDCVRRCGHRISFHSDKARLPAHRRGTFTFQKEVSFCCEEIMRVPISDGHGSENVFFLAYKPDIGQYLRKIEELNVITPEGILTLEDLEIELGSIRESIQQLMANGQHTIDEIRLRFAERHDWIREQLDHRDAALEIQLRSLLQQKETLLSEAKAEASRQFDAMLDRIRPSLSVLSQGGVSQSQ